MQREAAAKQSDYAKRQGFTRREISRACITRCTSQQQHCSRTWEGGTPLTLPPHCRHRAHSGTQPCRKAVLSTEVGREPHTPLMCRAGPRESGQGGVGWGHPTARRGWLRGLGVQDVMAACGCSYCNLGIPGAAGEGSKATPAPRSPQPLHAPCQPPAPRRHLPSPCKPSPQPLASSQDTCSPPTLTSPRSLATLAAP